MAGPGDLGFVSPTTCLDAARRPLHYAAWRPGRQLLDVKMVPNRMLPGVAADRLGGRRPTRRYASCSTPRCASTGTEGRCDGHVRSGVGGRGPGSHVAIPPAPSRSHRDRLLPPRHISSSPTIGRRAGWARPTRLFDAVLAGPAGIPARRCPMSAGVHRRQSARRQAQAF